MRGLLFNFVRNMKILRKKPSLIRTEGIARTAFKVALKERYAPLGRLDYPSGNIMMRVDSSLQLFRLNACRKEPETVKWIESQGRSRGEVFYDIGANVGAYSFVALCNGFERVYAFEPSFSTFAALNENIFINTCEGKITPFCIALGERTGLKEFTYRSLIPGEVCHLWDNSKKGRSQHIPLYALDDLIEQFKLPCPTCVKIDVDGFEYYVLEGMKRTLRRPELKRIQVEIADGWKDKVFLQLEEAGFRFDSDDSKNKKVFVNYRFSK